MNKEEVWARKATIYGHPFLLFDDGTLQYVGLSQFYRWSIAGFFYHRSAWN